MDQKTDKLAGEVVCGGKSNVLNNKKRAAGYAACTFWTVSLS